MNFPEDIHPRDLLSPYLDGELPNDALAAVETHVATCASCRSLLQDLRVLAAATARETPPPVPADLTARIRRALEGQEGSGRAPGRWSLGSYRLGLAAAASAVLIVVLWIVRPSTVPPEGVPVAPTTHSDREGELPPTPAESGDAAALRPDDSKGSLRPLGDLGRGAESKNQPSPPPPAPDGGNPRGAQRLQQEAAPKTAQPAAEWKSPLARTPVARGERPSASGEPSPGAPTAPGPHAGAAQGGVGAGLLGAARSEAGKAEAAAAPSTAPAPGRTLLVEYPDHRVSVSEDGTVVLSAGSYECAARLEGTSVDPGITALFALASSGGTEAEEARGAAPRGAPEVRLVEPKIVSERTGAAASRRVAAWKSVEVENRLKSLLRDRYLVLMESRCGPAPGNIRTP